MGKNDKNVGGKNMDENGLKITLLPSIFVDNNGKFMLNKALNRSGKIAGVCYNKEG